MKTYLLSLLAGIIGVGHLQAQTPSSFHIYGTIGQVTTPAKIYLLRAASVLDSAAVQNGVFDLRGTMDAPKEVELVLQRTGKLLNAFSGSHDRMRVFLEPGPVVLNSADSLVNATITGGPVTQDYQRLLASFKPLRLRQKAILAMYQQASEQQRQTPAFGQRMTELGTALSKDYERGYMAFIQANPTSWVSLDGLWTIMQPQYAQVAPLYQGLSATLKNSPPGREYGDLVQQLKTVAIGAQAPTFTQKTPAGKAISLVDYRGKYVLLDFWASWCGPCRAENPTVRKLYQQYRGRHFDILGVSLDDEQSRAKWVKAIADDHLPWVQVSDLHGWENEAARRYQIQGIPQNFLLDPTGKIIAINLRGDELKAALARYVK